jgi:hypothetical protein
MAKLPNQYKYEERRIGGRRPIRKAIVLVRGVRAEMIALGLANGSGGLL